MNTASSSASRRLWYTYTARIFSSRFTTTGWCLRRHAGSGNRPSKKACSSSKRFSALSNTSSTKELVRSAGLIRPPEHR